MAMKYFWMLLLLFFAGCKKYDDNQFVGRWIDSYDLGILGTQSTELKLYEDKSCNLKLFNMEMKGVWKVDDDTLILELKSNEDSENSSPSVSKFTIVRLNEKELFLKKPNTNDVTEYYKKQQDLT